MLFKVRILYCIIFCLMSTLSFAGKVYIISDFSADSAQRSAVAELSLLLDQAYKKDSFPVVDKVPTEQSNYILLGTLESNPQLKKYILPEDVSVPGSFVVKVVQDGERQIGIICGNHSRAVLDGVYALLEEIGYGFYLEYNALENLPDGPFTFVKWSLKDAPILEERFLFNWHNFLSGCTGWNLEHYKKWILQASRMRYNGIKLHYYGNNPGFQFTHNEETKPVGFLGSSHKGPEWGTQLINDVRRLPGGEIFDSPVFASDAALVPDHERVEAATTLVQQAMDYADSLGMKIHLGVDMDHFSCNPRNIINTLSTGARFKNGQLARPDTPEGHTYYTSQVKQLLKLYPQLDTIIVWSRGTNTDWMDIKEEHLPAKWKEELAAIRKANPGLDTYHEEYKSDKGAAHLAYSKITTAFVKILKEIGHDDVEVGYGGWWPRTGPQMWLLHNLVEDPTVSFWVKDYHRNFPDADAQAIYKMISETRHIYPIDWAQHDDGKYVGRPYQPHPNFADLAAHTRLKGYGIVHWMTWPLDLHVKNTMQQVWQSSLNEPYGKTCRQMAAHFFGPEYKESMGAYLEDWMDNAPQFGRETEDYYVGPGNRMHWTAGHLKKARERIKKLEQVNRSGMSETAKSFWDYFLMNEQFIAAVMESSQKLNEACDLVARRQHTGAQEIMKSSPHAKAVTLYSKAAQAVGLSRGEAGHLTNLANTWLPSYDAVAGQIGLQLIGYNFGPVPTDKKALGVALNKYYIDCEGMRWLVLNPYMNKWGQQHGAGKGFKTIEIAGLSKNATTDEEVAHTYIEQETPFNLSLKAITEHLIAGTYQLDLYFPASLVSAAGMRTVKVSAANSDWTHEIDLYSKGSPVKKVTFDDLEINQRWLSLKVEGVKGKAIISGARLMLKKPSDKQLLPVPMKTFGCSTSQPGNVAKNACDGNPATRWSAQGFPQWIEFELDKPSEVNLLELMPFKNRAYQFKLEGRNSSDQTYQMVLDATDNTTGGALIAKKIPPVKFQQYKITIVGCHEDSSGWVSFLEVGLIFNEE